MEGKNNISDYRRKLDRTLQSHDLKDGQLLHTLVKNQILQSSDFQSEGQIENVVERSKEMSNFLTMLRSASLDDVEGSKSSVDSHTGWKIKQDTEEIRVMYREGPEGTPFHTLLAEGYVDGPLDVCMCISWESGLYQKWWPQIAIPTFRVVSSKCLQTIRNGEQISLVRMKVTWPLSSREALVHYFAFEYFQDDLMVVLLNSISESETIDRSTHGFTRDGIPNAEEVVRIDVVGGFALQKVTSNRSYFRTIANMDIKLDFVPPALLNFISRQLIGSGFKLYKKAVASVVSKGDEKYREALTGPLYIRIREALFSGNLTESQAKENNSNDVTVIDIRNSQHEIEEFDENSMNERGSLDGCIEKSSRNSTDQITETFMADKEDVSISIEGQEGLKTNDITENYGSDIRNNFPISPKVKQALRTLENVISIIHEKNSNSENVRSGVEKSMSSEAYQMSRRSANFAETKIGSQELLQSLEATISSDNNASRRKGSNSYTRETNQSKIVPASQDEHRSSPSNSNSIALHSLVNSKNGSTVSENGREGYLPSVDANNINENKVTRRKNKKSRFCCFYFVRQS